MLIYAVILLISAFAVSAALTVLSRRFAIKMDLVARPKADRYHQRIVAMGGGIGIFSTLALAMLSAMGLAIHRVQALAPLADRVGLNPQDFLARCSEWGILLLSLSILFAMGLYDDFKGLGPLFKLIVQFVVAIAAAYLADVRVEFFIHNRLITAACFPVF